MNNTNLKMPIPINFPLCNDQHKAGLCRVVSWGCINHYYKTQAEKLKEETFRTFGNHILSFRTELEVLELFNSEDFK